MTKHTPSTRTEIPQKPARRLVKGLLHKGLLANDLPAKGLLDNRPLAKGPGTLYIATLLPAALLLAIVLQLTTVQATAQIPAEPQSRPIALVGATVHTVSGETIENATLVFDQGVITALGRSSDVTPPAGAEIVRLPGKHIYPGLIDAHSQMGLYEIGAVDMTVDVNEQGPINPNIRAERAFNHASRHIGVARSAGVLTAVSSPGGGLISGQSAAMALDGWSWDDMTLQAGTGLMINWPSPQNTSAYARQIHSLQEAFDNARAYKKAYRAMQAGQAPHHDFDSRWHSMIPVLEASKPVIISANDVRQIQDAVLWADQEQLNAVILGGRDADMASELLKTYDVPVILTTVLDAPARSHEGYDHSYTLPARLYEAGVHFAIAGAANPANANRLPWEAGAAIAFGLPAEQALKAVTLHPALILGLDTRIGALQTGMDATLLITDGFPLEYATQVEQVYIRGRKSDMNDQHRLFYEQYRLKSDQWLRR